MENAAENTGKPKVKIELIKNGPMKITGDFRLMDLKRGFEDCPGEVLLCRCGNSKNKPYCDDSCKKPF